MSLKFAFVSMDLRRCAAPDGDIQREFQRILQAKTPYLRLMKREETQLKEFSQCH